MTSSEASVDGSYASALPPTSPTYDENQVNPSIENLPKSPSRIGEQQRIHETQPSSHGRKPTSVQETTGATDLLASPGPESHMPTNASGANAALSGDQNVNGPTGHATSDPITPPPSYVSPPTMSATPQAGSVRSTVNSGEDNQTMEEEFPMRPQSWSQKLHRKMIRFCC